MREREREREKRKIHEGCERKSGGTTKLKKKIKFQIVRESFTRST